jgi:hypothetical protein
MSDLAPFGCVPEIRVKTKRFRKYYITGTTNTVVARERQHWM